MTEDKSFKVKDRQKFKGWLIKWQKARIPLLASLFIEILSPAKLMSLAFQKAEIDNVSTISHIEKSKRQLERLLKKPFEELPTVKRLLSKIDMVGGDYCYQNVVLHNYESAKDHTATAKNQLLGLVRDALWARLESAENPILKSSGVILNTEGWERKTADGDNDIEFADEDITHLYNHFELMLVVLLVHSTIR